MKRQRNTKQRKMVFDAVQNHMDHPSADQIYRKLRDEDPKISRGTVYRNLNLLAENGEVRHVDMPGVDRFDWRTEPHYHVLCKGCGRISDATLSYQKELDALLSEESGYKIARHTTVFEGLCPQCQREGAPEE
jgi:Fur family ferric uptake transcriptional regulator